MKAKNIVSLCAIASMFGFLGATITSSNAIAGIESPAGHGMLVLGKETIYLSHLPMFTPHHRYQIILEVGFKRGNQSVEQLYRDDQEKPGNEDTIYTLVPDRTFVLPNQVLSLKPFGATIFRGHFERGGEPILTGVTVEIKRIIHFHQLKSLDKSPGEMTFDEYLLFGKGSELFLAHWINGRPNYDQILWVKRTSLDLSDTALASGVLVRVPNRLKPHEKATGQIGDLRREPVPIGIEIGAEYYLEVAELF